ncbi:MAG: extracellular solute-binding protein, partial [Gorillibacterium sp.]|nr:extracellular solute-binding protein [Gorillibacterium sp.]
MKKLVVLTLTMMLVISLAACGGEKNNTSAPSASSPAESSTAPAAEKAEISVQLHITPNYTPEFWDALIKQFQEKNPGITVKRLQAPDDPEQYVKTLLATGDMPDVVHNIRFPELVEAGALRPFAIDDDLKQIRNVESGFIDGKLYNLNAVSQPQSLIFYNKTIFAEAGITATPKTWDELMADAELLKAKGVTPFLTSGEWVTGFTMSVFSAPETFGKNIRWYADRKAGKVKFTDPDWMEMANRWVDLNKKGYFNKGFLSIGYTQVEQEFLKGNGAMYPMGSWFTAAEKDAQKSFEVGVFPVPSKDGEVRLAGGINQSGFGISSTSKYPEAALKFVKFLLLDREVHKQLIEKDATISN